MLRKMMVLIGMACALALPAAAHAEPDVGPALWRVADEDTTIYLFGTIHALPSGVDWFRGPMVAAFDAADEIVFETLDENGDPAMFEQMMLPEGKSLRARLPAAERARFDTAIARTGIPLAMVDRMRPWLAAFVLGGMDGPRGRARQVSGALGVETVMGERARAAGKALGEVEGAAAQLAILNDAPSPLQIRFLAETLSAGGDEAELSDRLVEAWRTGDVATVEAVSGDWPADPQMRRVLLGQRNENWAGWVAERLEKPGTVMLAVGAAHLVGHDSLQHFLGERGIRAERIEP